MQWGGKNGAVGTFQRPFKFSDNNKRQGDSVDDLGAFGSKDTADEEKYNGLDCEVDEAVEAEQLGHINGAQQKEVDRYLLREVLVQLEKMITQAKSNGMPTHRRVVLLEKLPPDDVQRQPGHGPQHDLGEDVPLRVGGVLAPPAAAEPAHLQLVHHQRAVKP